MRVLVTGATGNVGRHVVRELLSQGAAVRALVRDAGVALGDGVELAVGDFEDPASLRAAASGVDAVFLTSADHPRKVEHENAVVDAVTGARVVKLASIGTETGSPVTTWDWHGRIVDHLTASGLPYVVLQANFFMSNLLMAAGSIAGAGKIFAPAGGAKIAMIDPRDVAAAAAAVLTTPGHEGRSYVLTGPEAITYDDVAATLSAALGQPVDFVDVPDEAMRGSLLDAGMPDWLAGFLPRLFGMLREGRGADVTEAVRQLTGREPRTFTEFARDHAALFT
jgi:uncharacterized protein YbjT (DUF2867 family)